MLLNRVMRWAFSSIQTLGVIDDDQAIHYLEYPLLSEIHFTGERIPLSLLPFMQQLCTGCRAKIRRMEGRENGGLENMQM